MATQYRGGVSTPPGQVNYLHSLSPQKKGTSGVAGRTPQAKSLMLRDPRSTAVNIGQPYSPLTTGPAARFKGQGTPINQQPGSVVPSEGEVPTPVLNDFYNQPFAGPASEAMRGMNISAFTGVPENMSFTPKGVYDAFNSPPAGALKAGVGTYRAASAIPGVNPACVIPAAAFCYHLPLAKTSTFQETI